MIKNDYYKKRILHKLGTIKDKEMRECIIKLLEETNISKESSYYDIDIGAYKIDILSQIKNCTTLAICKVINIKEEPIKKEVIQAISNVFMNGTRTNDYVCYDGKNNFVITFSGCDQVTVDWRIIEMKKELQNESIIKRNPIIMNTGISSYSNYKDTNELLKEAENALSHAPNGGSHMYMLPENEKAYIRKSSSLLNK